MSALWPFEIPTIGGKNNWNVSWFGPGAKHLRVMFGEGAFQLSSGKEHGVYLRAGIYLDKQESALPPNLIETGILLSMRCWNNAGHCKTFSDPPACLAAEFGSVQKQTADHVSVLTSRWHLSWWDIAQQRGRWGHYLSTILFNTLDVKISAWEISRAKNNICVDSGL